MFYFPISRTRNPYTQPLSHLQHEISPTLVDQVQDLPESEVYLRMNEPIYLVLESSKVKLKLKLKLKCLTTSLMAFLVLRPMTLHTDIYKIPSIFFLSILTLVSNIKKTFSGFFCFFIFYGFFFIQLHILTNTTLAAVPLLRSSSSSTDRSSCS